VSQLLVVSHSRTGSTQALTDALVRGATSEDINGVDVTQKRAFDAGADDVRACDAIVLGTPENFGYMSGALKDFFERIYYVLLEETAGRPYALYVKASTDGSGAVRSIERIVTGLKWRSVLPPLVVTGDVSDEHLEAAHEMGLTLAAGLEADIF
jgi:NAD(P)H-dependent FMN reductase